ncbi:DUF2817 domain-containing protein [Pantoea sp. B65]|uniref:DUF2817 domain-containing protein n=1 Tax=Pantoea sp. B65 TaxID=2813359 RepID=UPI0039B5D65E
MSSRQQQLPDFNAQRARFLAAVARLAGEVICYPHPLPGPHGEALATDVAIIGRPEARNLMVVVSGTHGVEGYYGSDSQIAWLDSLTAGAMPDDMALVMVHLINPWGSAHLRRVNEDNADLNRNFIDFSQPLPHNTAYPALHDIYLCRDSNGQQRQQADARMQAQCAQIGWVGVKRIVEAGQYQFADGIFFGGTAASWSHLTLKQIIQRHLCHAQQIISFDLHTGAGAYGHPMLMAIAERSYPALDNARQLFGPWLTVLITGKNRDSETGVTATATGYLSQFMLDNLPDVRLMQLVIECGTYDGETMHSLVRDDHWLHLYGDPASAEGEAIKLALYEGFYPADSDWQALVALRTRQIFARAFNALQASVEGHSGGF